jgi:hypothetical protein
LKCRNGFPFRWKCGQQIVLEQQYQESNMKLKLQSFGYFHTFFGILSLLLLAQTMLAETWFTNEVWISPVVQTNGGNGTLDYPYDGSTQANKV